MKEKIEEVAGPIIFGLVVIAIALFLVFRAGYQEGNRVERQEMAQYLLGPEWLQHNRDRQLTEEELNDVFRTHVWMKGGEYDQDYGFWYRVSERPGSLVYHVTAPNWTPLLDLTVNVNDLPLQLKTRKPSGDYTIARPNAHRALLQFYDGRGHLESSAYFEATPEKGK